MQRQVLPLIRTLVPAAPESQPVSSHAARYQPAVRNPGSNSRAYPSAAAAVSDLSYPARRD